MEHPSTTTIQAIHDAPHRCVVAVTGGGSGAISALLRVPGASRTVLESVVPYAGSALEDFLGEEPDSSCNESTALAMAVVAWQRAVALCEAAEDQLVGIAVTASLASDRPKRGDHRALVAVQTSTSTVLARLDLEKGARDRPAEEDLVTALMIDRLAETCDINDRPEIELGDGDELHIHQVTAGEILAGTWNGHTSIAWSLPDGSWAPEPPAAPAGILSGSFHPLHSGHEQLQQTAEHTLSGPVYYELPLINADKPPLEYLSIEERRSAFTDVPLALSRAATFAEKAGLYPGVTFVVGADTAARVVEQRFYESAESMATAFETIRSRGCRFLVGGRLRGSDFDDLEDLELPDDVADLFTGIPEARFRCDISSTALREAAD